MAKKKKSKVKQKSVPSAKRAGGKVAQAKRQIAHRIGQINRVINRLEDEVEGLVKKIVKQGERSRKELRKNFDDLLVKLNPSDLIAFASETRDDLEREVRRVAEEIVDAVKEVELLPHRLEVGALIKDMRRGVGDIVDQLNESGLVQLAKETVLKTRKGVLSLFSIPTQDEVVKLERKIVNLEKRLSNLTRRAA